jgi:hypothetical protein
MIDWYTCQVTTRMRVDIKCIYVFLEVKSGIDGWRNGSCLTSRVDLPNDELVVNYGDCRGEDLSLLANGERCHFECANGYIPHEAVVCSHGVWVMPQTPCEALVVSEVHQWSAGVHLDISRHFDTKLFPLSTQKKQSRPFPFF